MSLIKSSTRWVLFLSCNADPEHRHIMDLAFGLQSLESAGVNANDICIYIDGQDRSLIQQLISNGSTNNYVIKESKDFFADQVNNVYENLVLFVTGHGSIQGIDAPQPISPYALLRAIKTTPNLKSAIVYLGQCQAGIFNYIGAGRRVGQAGAAEPEVILIGATNLHESLSSSTQETMVNGQTSWVANLFLLNVFKWISSPIDIDGDGKITVIDSYKYAGAASNTINKSIKITAFVRSIELHGKWMAARQADQMNSTQQTKLTLQALETQYESELGVHYIHQECWILNSIPAQSIEF
ncbi:hypothetical protein I5M30_05500 [Pseudomonas aeruginosa]|nr:hypothetical protein [Pseudomonas aeruginosa]